jgi:hypothetical protein
VTRRTASRTWLVMSSKAHLVHLVLPSSLAWTPTSELSSARRRACGYGSGRWSVSAMCRFPAIGQVIRHRSPWPATTCNRVRPACRCSVRRYTGPLGGCISDRPAERRASPRDDLLTSIATAVYPDRKRSPSCWEAALRILGDRSDLQRHMREDRSRIPTFIEQCLQMVGPGAVTCAASPTPRQAHAGLESWPTRAVSA